MRLNVPHHKKTRGRDISADWPLNQVDVVTNESSSLISCVNTVLYLQIIKISFELSLSDKIMGMIISPFTQRFFENY